jgi:hypothetical protein
LPEPPVPTTPGNSIVPGDNGVYIEFDEDGVPLGEWRWDEPTEQWIFDEYPPLANLPQTGIPFIPESGKAWFFIGCGLLAMALLFCILGVAALRLRREPKYLK